MCKYPKCAVLDLKECIEIFQVECLESYCSKIFNQTHADTSFRNVSGASTKWRETFENMSFGPKVVDWACSLRHNKKWFWRHKLVHLMHPILIFTMGQERQRNDVKPPETWVLEVKYVVRNQMDILEHRNDVQIPKMCCFGPKGVHWNLSSRMSRVLLFWNIQSNECRY